MSILKKQYDGMREKMSLDYKLSEETKKELDDISPVEIIELAAISDRLAAMVPDEGKRKQCAAEVVYMRQLGVARAKKEREQADDVLCTVKEIKKLLWLMINGVPGGEMEQKAAESFLSNLNKQ